MGSLTVEGGHRLSGTLEVSGSKNASLPIMAASILTNGAILKNIPKVSDVYTMIKLLENHGASVSFENNKVEIDSSNINNLVAPHEIVSKMRASIWVLGPLLSKFGNAVVSMPGGCTLGARQIDLHIDGLKAMGAEVYISDGYVHASAKDGLKGCFFHFTRRSVGATINLIMSAVFAIGDTTLSNCTIEPEIVDLCKFLVASGAKIDGIGSQKLVISGISRLNKITYKVISDRIEFGTYAIAAAITQGNLKLTNIDYDIVQNICYYLGLTGIKFDTSSTSHIGVTLENDITPSSIQTNPYPEFPTDLQAQYTVLMSVANGMSMITENIFENRMMHIQELCRMNADIKIQNYNTAIVSGVKHLDGADVRSSDLRASVSLVLAGLAARGNTIVRKIHHLDRGYEKIEEKLNSCGAKIIRRID